MAKTIACSIKVEAGVGSGIGGSVSANVCYFPVGVSFMAATTDTASFSLANGLETKITTAASASVSAFDCLSIGYTEGRQHLYGAENCSCSFGILHIMKKVPVRHSKNLKEKIILSVWE